MNKPKASPYGLPSARALQVLLRSIHIVAMALVLGGLAQGGTHETLWTPILVTILSGVLLLGLDLARGSMVISQGSGVAALFKLALLGLGNIFPAVRLPFYLAATFVASVGSHMPARWRHFSLVTGKVAEKKGKAE
ncbi:MAG: hypothetical protein Q8O00_10535 [Holophaga sp.]|nr:hypothetical protein [Holophaga sp.]